MYIASQILIATLTTTPATDGVRDVCDIVDRRTGTPTICKPYKQGAPVFDANVCCAGSTCFPSTSGQCQSGESLCYCGLGEQKPTGEVVCYFEVPNYCDVHPCGTSVTPAPQEGSICCNEGICWEDQTGSNNCEVDDIYWCSNGVSNPDGTITCFDD